MTHETVASYKPHTLSDGFALKCALQCHVDAPHPWAARPDLDAPSLITIVVRASVCRDTELGGSPMLWGIHINHMNHVERRTRPHTVPRRPNDDEQ